MAIYLANTVIRVNDKLESILTGFGVKVGRQNYTYHSAGQIYTGENVYGILQAPRGDATEAIVLVAAWKSIDEQLNRNGIALVLTLARYFKRQSPPVSYSLMGLDFKKKLTDDRLVIMVEGYYPSFTSR